MNRVDAAQEQYEEQFTPFAHAEQADRNRKEYLKERTLYHLLHPRGKDVDVLIMEDDHLANFLISYYSATTEDGQKEAIIDFLAAAEQTSLRVAVEEADG